MRAELKKKKKKVRRRGGGAYNVSQVI